MTGHPRRPGSALRVLIALTITLLAPRDPRGRGPGAGGTPPSRPPPAALLPAWDGSIDLYRDGVFTTQKSWLWCTAAGVQIVRNIVERDNDHSTSGQRRYFDWMRKTEPLRPARIGRRRSAGLDRRAPPFHRRPLPAGRQPLVLGGSAVGGGESAQDRPAGGADRVERRPRLDPDRLRGDRRSAADRRIRSDERPRGGAAVRSPEQERLRHATRHGAQHRASCAASSRRGDTPRSRWSGTASTSRCSRSRRTTSGRSPGRPERPSSRARSTRSRRRPASRRAVRQPVPAGR